MDRCPHCGKSYALVGRVHRCVPIAKAEPVAVTTRSSAGFDRVAYQREYMRQYRARKKLTAVSS